MKTISQTATNELFILETFRHAVTVGTLIVSSWYVLGLRDLVMETTSAQSILGSSHSKVAKIIGAFGDRPWLVILDD